MAARGPKMAYGVWKGVQSLVIGRYDQLSLNKFFDPSTPFFDQSEASKSKMAAKGPQNSQRGLERGPTLGYWPFRITFAK